MKKWWKTLAAYLCIAAMMGIPGCFGKSPITSSVIKWHSDLKMEKFSKEVVYFPMFILVLPFTSIVDAFIVNAIKFWQNDDPLAASALGVPADIDFARLEWRTEERAGGPVRSALLAAPDADGKAPRIIVAGEEMRITDREGREVLVVRTGPNGSVMVEDRVMGTAKTFSPAEVAVAFGS